MEAKITKGEWAWQKFGDKYNLTAQHGMREIILSASINEDKSLQPYLSMNEDGILKPINPNHPNAKLIAAAPDLLEACIEALKHHQGGHSYIGYKLRKAIKKATE